MEIPQINPFSNLLAIYNEMHSIEADLQNQLNTKNQVTAEKDILQLIGLAHNMELVAHEVGHISPLLCIDADDMEKVLGKMASDVYQGNFGEAISGNGQILSDLTDIRHVII